VQDRTLLVFPQTAAAWVHAHLKPIAWHEVHE
jgi:hypothetical protein